MKTSAHKPATEPEPQETNAVLQRILSAVEKNERNRRLEIASAVLLGLATTASAWCAYQATLWSGAQTFHLAAAEHEGRESTEQTLAANQSRSFDVQGLVTYLEAKSRGDEKLAGLFFTRFRPEARKALDAWFKTDPFNNPNASLRPFEMAEYVQPEKEAAKRAEDEAARLMTEARQASKNGDTYILLTVLFASVLFFGGIGGTFVSQRLSTIVFVIAVVLFGVTLFALGTMPICRA
jgi:hypothetical protein